MADDKQHFANDETAPQQIHPDKPPRDDRSAGDNPNEIPPGRPQHEAKDPDEHDW